MAEAPLILELRKWRLATSNASRIPAYAVFDDVTLSEIGRIRPTTLASLEAVRGMGPVRVRRWGTEILALVHGNPPVKSESTQSTTREQSTTPDAEITFKCENELRARRFEQATRRRIPAFHIFSDAVMRRLARSRPQNTAELSRVPDVGPLIVENYGRWILTITRKYPSN